MSRSVPLSAAKAQLAALVQAAFTGEVVHISRHGRPAAVLLSEQTYAELQRRDASGALWEAVKGWRGAGRKGFSDDWPLASDAAGDRQVDAWRDRSPGREVHLG